MDFLVGLPVTSALKAVPKYTVNRDGAVANPCRKHLLLDLYTMVIFVCRA